MSELPIEAEDSERAIMTIARLAVLIQATADAPENGFDKATPIAWAAGEIAFRALHLLNKTQQQRESQHV